MTTTWSPTCSGQSMIVPGPAFGSRFFTESTVQPVGVCSTSASAVLSENVGPRKNALRVPRLPASVTQSLPTSTPGLALLQSPT